MTSNDVTAAGQFSLMGTHSNGLRLNKLEVYNWGTFDEKIWLYRPNGNTSLLTGDSGSGKSTLVDALITLMVSPRKVTYNKAADATARERSVMSYVHGYYGQKYAYEGKGKPEALRDYRQYSVLLATFADSALHKVVTLAVFFWFREQNGPPQRFYVVAQRELSIERHFSAFQGDVKKLKAALRSAQCELFDDYKPYAVCYQKALGNLSPRAIDLFQQTISMKKVEALTDFVRGNMLEETGISAEVDNLLGQYHSLNSAYEAVQKARRQTELLQPICAHGRAFSQQRDALHALERGKGAVAHWFASQKVDLFTTRILQLEQGAERAERAQEHEQQRLQEIDNEILRLNGEILQNGGGALEALREKLVQLEQARTQKQKNRTQYLAQSNVLALAPPDTAHAFAENLQQVEAFRQALQQERPLAKEQLGKISAELERKKQEAREIAEEITSLKGRTSNIPKELILLRQRMCAALSLGEERLPFAGELLEVAQNELEWEGAMERLLHNFALSILVAKEDYPAVSKWVNGQHLGARLVYYAAKPRPGAAPAIHAETAAGKLAVKQGTAFTQWLTRALAERFSHVCCRDVAAFRQEKRAITLTGQIKSAGRHEKDDRRALTDRTRYVLGFSNQKKIETLEAKAAEWKKAISDVEAQYRVADERYDALGEKERALTTLCTFVDFSELDVQGAQRELAACQQRIDVLSQEEQEGVLAALRAQLEKEVGQKAQQQARVTAAAVEKSGVDQQLSDTKVAQLQNNNTLRDESPAETSCYPQLEANRAAWIGTDPLTLENSARQEAQYRRKLESECSALQKSSAELEIDIVRGMLTFKNAFPLETREMDDKIEFLAEYQRMLNQLITDDLPRYEREFRRMLTTQVLQQIALFQITLKNQYNVVKERIASINSSLYGIDYNPSRYIELNCEDNPDAEIRLFRGELKACTEGATGAIEDEDGATERFLKIKNIIERFEGREGQAEADKKWRKKVTDVRNWFLFSASERWRETKEEYEHYSDSDGKSGGQKEKLAYTVLAASLVYNYGLHEDYIDQSTFRLVVIDEAFLRVSDTAAEYGLQLFEKLRFQMVIVTPLLKIATIEPFIEHVGFVSHNDVTHKSTLMNIPIKVYKQQRKAWEDAQHAKLERWTGN